MNLWAAELIVRAWWCGLVSHRWTYTVRNTRRLCIRCGRRQWRIDPGGEWQDERRS